MFGEAADLVNPNLWSGSRNERHGLDGGGITGLQIPQMRVDSRVQMRIQLSALVNTKARSKLEPPHASGRALGAFIQIV